MGDGEWLELGGKIWVRGDEGSEAGVLVRRSWLWDTV